MRVKVVRIQWNLYYYATGLHIVEEALEVFKHKHDEGGDAKGIHRATL